MAVDLDDILDTVATESDGLHVSEHHLDCDVLTWAEVLALVTEVKTLRGEVETLRAERRQLRRLLGACKRESLNEGGVTLRLIDDIDEALGLL